MPAPTLDFYFAGPEFEKAFKAQYKEYAKKPGWKFQILSDGDQHYWRFVDSDANGPPPIDQSQNCPGAPDCP